MRIALAVAWLFLSYPMFVGHALADETVPSRALNTTTSLYMNSADPARLRDLGCVAGKRTIGLSEPQDDLVILMFGSPTARNGVEGATVYRGAGAPSIGYASAQEISVGAAAFGSGYLSCSLPHARLSLIIGTSNWGDHVTPAHGQAWGEMIKRVATWIGDVYFSNRLAIYGGSDIEVGWGKPLPARAWVDAYVATGAPALYDFGDAEGCPTSDGKGNSCHNGWTQDDIWYIAWGSGNSRPLPQIYSGVYAKQWYQLLRYSYTKATSTISPMTIAGVLTMYGDCQQIGGCGPDFNSTPREGYQHLADLLALDKGTGDHLRYSTDIKKAWLP